uniref:protein-disulfide reductase n=1 Tax=Steinernema glaseri TaxID=37863 RepID=A0A1I8A6E6_9BILA
MDGGLRLLMINNCQMSYPCMRVVLLQLQLPLLDFELNSPNISRDISTVFTFRFHLVCNRPSAMSILQRVILPFRATLRPYSTGFLKDVELHSREGSPPSVDFSKPTLLYFSAGWCRSCRLFTPKLKRFYEGVNGEVNVVWVSRDKSSEDQLEYYEKSLGPWPYIPFGNNTIREYLEKYEVKTIPAILQVDEKGAVIDDTVRRKIEEASSSTSESKLLLEKLRK